MTLLEVRCCCDPNRLIGHLPVSDPEQPSVSYIIQAYALPPSLADEAPLSYEQIFERLTLEIASLALHGWGDRWRAIKANEVPVEKLRLIPGFIENKIGGLK